MSAQLDIDLLRSFTVVANIGVLSRAAEQVGRTQAGVLFFATGSRENFCRASSCHAALLRNQHAHRDKLISQQSTNCEGYEEP